MTNGGGANNGGASDGGAPQPAATQENGQPAPTADTSAQGSGSQTGGQEVAVAPTASGPLPTAPVISQVQPAINPLSQVSAVCVTFFDDTNQNRLQDSGESLLADGSIALMSGGTSVGEYNSDGTSDPHCFDNLNPGSYVAVATAPSGFGLTTPNQYRVEVNTGTSVNVVFGAAQGVVVPNTPPPDGGGAIAQTTTTPKDDSNSPLLRNLGLIVFGLAGVVFVAGIGVALLMRRR
jgi:hypothetical protein